jgi:peptidoglycan/xylan/chitin deacetylase (PgdA/CDA1 family)
MKPISPSAIVADREPAHTARAVGEAQPRHAIALMYHALASAGHPSDQDPHYSLVADAFGEQLDRILRDTGGAGSARDWLAGTHQESVLLTFDDGHVSNHRLAFPMLVERGMRADFFINPANVGQPDFAGWSELRCMAAAGMSIQSHGYDHRYLTHLTPRELRESLRAARIEIEDRVGTPVKLLAPPGGRMPAGLGDIARECGYSHLLTSRPGRLRRGNGISVLPRLAVTAGMDQREFAKWIAGRPGPILQRKLRYTTLAFAKHLLGDALYEQARARLLVGNRR